MSLTRSDTVRVPGASLYYEMSGSGPMLLILQGGDGDAQGSMGIVDQLVAHYTVVTYDRRGLSRSKLDELTEPPRIETHSDDVHRLLASLTSEPVFVLGNSIGALIGLDLVARHPEQVRVFVAHEPPLPELLPDAERTLAVQAQEEMEETYQREGVIAAMKKSLAMSGFNLNDREQDAVLPQPTPYRAANLEFFYKYDAPAAHHYRLDMAALQAVAQRIAPAGGRSSKDAWPRHCTESLAERLGTAFVEFPGGHNGHVFHPRAFAAQLHEMLSGEQGK